MRSKWIVISGTDTGVGKTLLTAALARAFGEKGVKVAALKPFASGGRDDARCLQESIQSALSLDEINPWHFRAALAPEIAARREGRTVSRAAVLRYLRTTGQSFQKVLIEGAGGLLSPLGKDFDARDMIEALEALPVIVCPNRLGAINQTLLAVAALKPRFARRAVVVLNSPATWDASVESNGEYLSKRLGKDRVCFLPRASRRGSDRGFRSAISEILRRL